MTKRESECTNVDDSLVRVAIEEMDMSTDVAINFIEWDAFENEEVETAFYFTTDQLEQLIYKLTDAYNAQKAKEEEDEKADESCDELPWDYTGHFDKE